MNSKCFLHNIQKWPSISAKILCFQHPTIKVSMSFYVSIVIIIIIIYVCHRLCKHLRGHANVKHFLAQYRLWSVTQTWDPCSTSRPLNKPLMQTTSWYLTLTHMEVSVFHSYKTTVSGSNYDILCYIFIR